MAGRGLTKQEGSSDFCRPVFLGVRPGGLFCSQIFMRLKRRAFFLITVLFTVKVSLSSELMLL